MGAPEAAEGPAEAEVGVHRKQLEGGGPQQKLQGVKRRLGCTGSWGARAAAEGPAEAAGCSSGGRRAAGLCGRGRLTVWSEAGGTGRSSHMQGRRAGCSLCNGPAAAAPGCAPAARGVASGALRGSGASGAAALGTLPDGLLLATGLRLLVPQGRELTGPYGEASRPPPGP